MSDDNQIDSLTVNVGLDTGGFRRGQQEVDAGLDQLEQGAKEATDSVNDLGEAANTTGNNLGDLGGKTNEASSQIDELGHSSGNAAHKIKELQEQIEELQQDAEDAADDIADLQDELDNLTQSSGKTGRTMGSHFDQVTRSVRGLANEVMGLMALNKVASVANGKGVGGTVAAGVDSQASLGRQAHNLNIAPRKLAGWELTAEKFGGSQQEAQQFMQHIQDMITSNKIDAGQLSPLLTRYVNLHNPDGSMKSTDRISFEILKAIHDHANDPDAPNDINYAIRQSLGGGTGIVEMARLGPERLQKELEAAEARSRVTTQGTEEVTRFSEALAEARQQVAGFGTGLLEQLSKHLGPFLEDLNKNHPELVAAGGAALTVGAPLAGMAVLRKWMFGARAAGAAGAGAAGAGAAAGSGALTALGVPIIAAVAALSPGNLLDDNIEGDDEEFKHIGDIDDDGTPMTRHVSRPNDTSWYDIPAERRKDITAQLKKYEKLGLDAEQQIRTLPTIAEQQAVTDHYRRILWSRTGGQSELENQREFDRQRKAAPQPAIERTLPLANDTGKSRYQGKIPKALDELQDYLSMLEDQNGLPKGLLTDIAMKESGGNPNAASKRNGKVIARGMFQFTPGTAMQYNLANPHDPMESARAAAQFYGQLSKDFDGDIDKMMASYNSGPGLVGMLGRNLGDRWRDGLGPEGQGYIGYEQVPGANKLLKYAAKHSGLRADRALMAFPLNGNTPQQPRTDIPQHLLGMNDPANYPGVQQAMIRNDNRRITNTTHIDTLQVTTGGGSPEAMARGAQSALQRHPLALNGSDYA